MNTTGGAVVMGSYPYPPNGLVEIDYEFILIFKKPGESKKVLKEVKEASKLSKEEWKEYFSGHWHFGGAKQVGHEAMFPEELPLRLIRMFTFQGDTVLDPFLGSGTTVKMAIELSRNAIGYEINEGFLSLIEEKIGLKDKLPIFAQHIEIIRRKNNTFDVPKINYIPAIQNANPLIKPSELDKDTLFKVVKILSEDKLKLDNGQVIKFLGVIIEKPEETLNYLNQKILGEKILFKNNNDKKSSENFILAYVYLKNKLFINGYLIKSGLAVPELGISHKLYNKYIQFWKHAKDND